MEIVLTAPWMILATTGPLDERKLSEPSARLHKVGPRTYTRRPDVWGSYQTLFSCDAAAAMAGPQAVSGGNNSRRASSLLNQAAILSTIYHVNLKNRLLLVCWARRRSGCLVLWKRSLYEKLYVDQGRLIKQKRRRGDTIFNACASGGPAWGQSKFASGMQKCSLGGCWAQMNHHRRWPVCDLCTDINSNLLVGVALHELTHAMGRYIRLRQRFAPVFLIVCFTSDGHAS